MVQKQRHIIDELRTQCTDLASKLESISNSYSDQVAKLSHQLGESVSQIQGIRDLNFLPLNTLEKTLFSCTKSTSKNYFGTLIYILKFTFINIYKVSGSNC